MINTIISLKVEPELKAQAAQVAEDLGIPLATYLKMCLKKLTQEQRVDFSLAEVPKDSVHIRWKAQKADAWKKRNLSKRFDSLSDLKADLMDPA